MWTGEVTALVADADGGRRACQRRAHRFQHEAHLQRQIECPTDNEARVPVQHGEQVHPTGA